MKKHLVPVVFLLAVSLAGGVVAQNTQGTLTGTVVDQVGSRLPGVRVNVRNEDPGATLSTTTNEAGEFIFLLQPGTNYTLTAELGGFSQGVIAKIPVPNSEVKRLDVKLTANKRSATIPDPFTLGRMTGLTGSWIFTDGTSAGTARATAQKQLMTHYGISQLMVRSDMNLLLDLSLIVDKTDLMGNLEEITMRPYLKDSTPRDTLVFNSENAAIEDAKISGTKFQL